MPEINVALSPDEKGVESLARQIKVTARAYPLFDIARLILQKPERYSVVFSVKKNAEGKAVQPLFLCALDDTLWLSEDEAVAHVLNKHFGTFYTAERTATEPPKGKYTFVAQCGMSGVILGPPNYHDYQNQLRKLHAERFSRMPFEAFKSRVRIVSDEAVVKKWIEERSFKTDYVALNVPEPLRLESREAVEKHFRETHKENIIKPVETHVQRRGRAQPAQPELDVARAAIVGRPEALSPATGHDAQPAIRATRLASYSLDKTVTHVSVARPHYLDLETTPVSEGVKRIVDFINAHTKTTRRKLMEALAPTPRPAPKTVIAFAWVFPKRPRRFSRPRPPRPRRNNRRKPPSPAPNKPAGDFDGYWLIHRGHVIEFAGRPI